MLNKSQEDNQLRFNVYRAAFILLAIQSAAIAVWLLSLQRSPDLYEFFGIPLRRQLFAGLSLLLTCLWISLFIFSRRNHQKFTSFDQRFRFWLGNKYHWRCLILLSTGSTFFFGLCLLALRYNSLYFLAPPQKTEFNVFVYHVNQVWLGIKSTLSLLQPLALLLIGFGAVITLLLPFVFYGPRELHNYLKQHKIYFILGIYTIVLVLWRLIGWTRPIIEPDFASIGWYPLGAPLLDSQVLLAFILGFGLAGLGIAFPKAFSEKTSPSPGRRHAILKVDLLIGMTIWLMTMTHWVLLPTQINWFVSEPRFPNFEFYPNSDALFYDATGQSMLVGAGMQSPDLEYPRRPVYATFIAIWHALVGQDYEIFTRSQAALFALFPMLIYFLVSSLQNRLSGILAAILVTLREGNSISLSAFITVSNSRMIMSEMPATIGVAVMICLLVVWLHLPRYRPWTALLIGASIAATLLVRIEAIVFLPIAIFICAALSGKSLRQWLITGGTILLGAILFLVPWLWRNWSQTGLIYLERPGERVAFVLARTDLISATAPGATAQQPSGTGVAARGYAFMRRFLSSYLNNQLQAALIFPDGFRLVDSWAGFSSHGDWEKFFEACCSRQDYLNRLPFWMWRQWKGEIPEESILPIMFTLLILCVGVVKITEQKGIIGLAPLLVVLTHYLASSMVRVSGGRFIQFVDWIWIIYFGAGIGQIILGVLAYFGVKIPGILPRPIEWVPSPELSSSKRVQRYQFIGAACLVVAIGVVLPLVEFGVQPRYSRDSKQAWQQELMATPDFLDQYPDLIHALQSTEYTGLKVLQGRALYPRYYAAMQGEPGSLEYPFTVKDFSRFSFYLTGPQDTAVLLPMSQPSQLHFPNASDTLVIGCQDQGYIRALIVYLKSTKTILASTEISDEPVQCNR